MDKLHGLQRSVNEQVADAEVLLLRLIQRFSGLVQDPVALFAMIQENNPELPGLTIDQFAGLATLLNWDSPLNYAEVL